MIRFIMWMTKGPTDTQGTFEFTDWGKVDDYAKQIAAQK
jgi:menaquinone-dependent protoporphyrinogen oxidase